MKERIVLILIQNTQGKILVQKRSKRKGGTYGLTSGHVNEGESSIHGIIRELKEELGIIVKKNEIKLIYSEVSEQNDVIYDLYYLKKDCETSNMILQKEEVEKVMWLSVEEVQTLCSRGDFKKEHIEAFEIIINEIKEREWKYAVNSTMGCK